MYINLKKIKNRIFSAGLMFAVFLSVFTALSITVSGEEIPRQPQDVSLVINAATEQLASTVKEPSFGTSAGEWTVLCLARGGYYEQDNAYFLDYYNRIVDYVNTKAATVNLNGALHKSKSTDNSRVILALSSIGKDAASVGNWNLFKPYEDFKWIKKQGINGAVFALIALDSVGYQTTDTSIRQQCVDFILERQIADGGWALNGEISDPDVTAMVLQSLYPYKERSDVLSATESAFECLSNMQREDGGYASWGTVNSESCAQVIVALSTWGINPDTDRRFIKNGNSVIDNILTYYVIEEAKFKHVIAGESDAMATDQACYALVAYNRLLNGKTALYDMTDVIITDDEENKEDNNGNNIQNINQNNKNEHNTADSTAENSNNIDSVTKESGLDMADGNTDAINKNESIIKEDNNSEANITDNTNNGNYYEGASEINAPQDNVSSNTDNSNLSESANIPIENFEKSEDINNCLSNDTVIPKTGENDYIIFSIFLILLSILGLVILREFKTGENK